MKEIEERQSYEKNLLQNIYYKHKRKRRARKAKRILAEVESV